MPKRPARQAIARPAAKPAASSLWQTLRGLRARGRNFQRRATYKHFMLDYVSFKDRIVIDVDRGQASRAKAARDAVLMREGFSVLKIKDDADAKRVEAAIAETLRARRAAPVRLTPRRVVNHSAARTSRTQKSARVGAAATPAKLASMSKAKKPRAERRPRGEIDRNYFFGDVLIKTGVAVAVALLLIALYTPVTLMGAINDGAYDYLGLMGVFGALSLTLFLAGRHLRKEATHWDFD